METKAIISIAIGIFVCAILFPLALNMIWNTDTESWSNTDATLFTLIGTVGVLVVIVGIVYMIKAD